MDRRQMKRDPGEETDEGNQEPDGDDRAPIDNAAQAGAAAAVSATTARALGVLVRASASAASATRRALRRVRVGRIELRTERLIRLKGAPCVEDSTTQRHVLVPRSPRRHRGRRVMDANSGNLRGG